MFSWHVKSAGSGFLVGQKSRFGPQLANPSVTTQANKQRVSNHFIRPMMVVTAYVCQADVRPAPTWFYGDNAAGLV